MKQQTPKTVFISYLTEDSVIRNCFKSFEGQREEGTKKERN